MSIKYAEIQNLLKLSEQYDEEGKSEEAAALHVVASRLIQAAEDEKKEEEDSGFGFSGKQKSAIRGLQKAAERADKVFGNKIPKSCRKISSLVDDLLEECSKCDLD